MCKGPPWHQDQCNTSEELMLMFFWNIWQLFWPNIALLSSQSPEYLRCILDWDSWEIRIYGQCIVINIIVPFTISISIDNGCYTSKLSFDNPSLGVYLDLITRGVSSSQGRMKLSSLCELPALHHKGPRLYLALLQTFSPSFPLQCCPQLLQSFVEQPSLLLRWGTVKK